MVITLPASPSLPGPIQQENGSTTTSALVLSLCYFYLPLISAGSRIYGVLGHID